MASDDYSENFDAIFSEPRLTRADVRDEAAKLLRDIDLFNRQAIAGQQAAIHEVTTVHPDFEQKRSQMLATLAELPLLRDAIGAAEANPSLAPSLPALYEIAYRVAQAPTNNTATAAAASERSSVESQSAAESDLSSEDVQYSASLASQRIDLSPEKRKQIIASLEKHGVLDVPF